MTTPAPRRSSSPARTGLVGSHAVEEALRRGPSRPRPGPGHRATRAGSTRWGVEKVPGDLADAEALRRGVAGADWVFNCAAKVGDWGTLEEFRRLNVDALRLLLDAAADARVERFVHVSSLGRLRGPRPLRHRRDHAPGGRLARRLHPLQDRGRGPGPAATSSEQGLPVGRSSGPASSTARATGRSCPSCSTPCGTGRFAYFGSGEQALNCIYVKNLVHGIFLAAEVPEAVGEVFNLTDGERVSKRQFVGRVAELAGPEAARAEDPALAGLDPGDPDGAAGQASQGDRARRW